MRQTIPLLKTARTLKRAHGRSGVRGCACRCSRGTQCLRGAPSPLEADSPFGNLPSEDGHTVAEAAVALALLTVVLLPATAFLARSMARSSGADRAVALAVARTAMEESLSSGGASSRGASEEAFGSLPWQVGTTSWETGNGRWRVKRSVKRAGSGLVTITVAVGRAGRDATAASLVAQRKVPEAFP